MNTDWSWWLIAVPVWISTISLVYIFSVTKHVHDNALYRITCQLDVMISQLQDIAKGVKDLQNDDD